MTDRKPTASRPAQAGHSTGAKPRPSPAAASGAKRAASPPARKPATTKAPAGKPVAPKKPGDGLLGWFGRQVGHVAKAVSTDVTQPPPRVAKPPPAGPAKPAGAKSKAASRGPAPASGGPAGGPRRAASPPTTSSVATPVGSASPAAGAGQIIYRADRIEEVDLPDQPGVTLRRTIIDEVIVGANTTDAVRAESASGK
ncbi:MAG: hypothetical protein JWO31_185 [Phycisphaerales bacterium]|nr:hypothetical protein [Phycisphaerales bacterium]